MAKKYSVPLSRQRDLLTCCQTVRSNRKQAKMTLNDEIIPRLPTRKAWTKLTTMQAASVHSIYVLLKAPHIHQYNLTMTCGVSGLTSQT